MESATKTKGARQIERQREKRFEQVRQRRRLSSTTVEGDHGGQLNVRAILKLGTDSERLPYAINVLRLLLVSPGNPELELISLCMKMAAHRNTAETMCEGLSGYGLRRLIERAFWSRDANVMRIIKTISTHDGPIKIMFNAYVRDLAGAAFNSVEDEFSLECLGVLGNLTFPHLYVPLLDEYQLIPWFERKLEPGSAEDNWVLAVVTIVGTLSQVHRSAKMLADAGIIQILIELLKAKHECEELVYSIEGVFFELICHDITRETIVKDTQVPDYINYLRVHADNVAVRKACESFLDLVAELYEEWARHSYQSIEVDSNQNDEIAKIVRKTGKSRGLKKLKSLKLEKKKDKKVNKVRKSKRRQQKEKKINPKGPSMHTADEDKTPPPQASMDSDMELMQHQHLAQPIKRLQLVQQHQHLAQPIKRLQLVQQHQHLAQPIKRLQLVQQHQHLDQPIKRLQLVQQHQHLAQPIKRLQLVQQHQHLVQHQLR